MKIIWSDFAVSELKDIFQHYKTVAGKKIAQNLIDSIFKSTRQLIKYPNSGQIEESLKELNQGHRYLVISNYKIIYKKVKEGLLITDVFDTRQSPVKINNPKRKKGE